MILTEEQRDQLQENITELEEAYRNKTKDFESIFYEKMAENQELIDQLIEDNKILRQREKDQNDYHILGNAVYKIYRKEPAKNGELVLRGYLDHWRDRQAEDGIKCPGDD